MIPAADGQTVDNVVGRLLESARVGCSKSLGQLTQLCRRYLMRVACEELPHEFQPHLDPSDLVQDTLLEAVRDFEHFTGDSYHELLLWLRHILLCNVADTRRYYRGAKHDIRREVAFRAMDASGDRRLDDSHRWLAPVAWALAQEEKEQLVRALDSLMEPYATVVELHCGQGLSYDEIGHQLRRSPEAVSKLWSRALRRLHDCVNPAAPDHRDRQ